MRFVVGRNRDVLEVVSSKFIFGCFVIVTHGVAAAEALSCFAPGNGKCVTERL